MGDFISLVAVDADALAAACVVGLKRKCAKGLVPTPHISWLVLRL